MLRRLSLVGLFALLAVVGLDWNPATPPWVLRTAAAQPPFTFGLNSQGIIQYSTASVSVSNSNTDTALWSSVISAGLTATAANANWSPSSVQTPPPLHLVLQGQLTTNIGVAAVGNINMGINYGGGVTGVASMALLNAIALPNNVNSAPWQLDVWLAPVATATNSSLPGGGGACFVHMLATLQIATATNTNGLVAPMNFTQQVCGTTGGGFLASAEQINVLVRWASASLTNSINVYRGVLMLGM